MGKAMSNDTSTIIVRALAQGHSRNDIAKMCNVSTRAVTRVSTNLKKHGSARPPPSGLKQGRPARLTRKQAEALLVWVTARDYKFYVKDLVRYLKEHHGYQGCDGTVRRGMVRAGFKRKEPYQKSEITVWIPPDHAPQFDIIAEDEPPTPSKKAPAGVPQQPVQQGPQPINQLEHHSQVPMPPAPMQNGSSDAASMLDSYPNYYHQHHVAFQAQTPIPQVDPSLYQIQSSQPPQTQQQQQSQSPMTYQQPQLPSQRNATAQQTPATISLSKKLKKPKKEEQLQQQVASMHEEMLKQVEMIRQLQMQLAQNSAHNQPQSSMQPMSINGQGINPSLQQRSQQQQGDSFQVHEEEVAV